MSARRSKKLLASVLIAGLLVVTLVYYMNAIIRQGQLTFPMIMIAAVLMALSIGAIYGVYRTTLKKGHERDLEGKYLDLYERVVDFLNLENLSKKNREEVREEWLDIILCAQEEQRHPDTLYGEDFDRSMTLWVEEFGAPDRKLSLLIDGVMLYCVFLIFLQVINFAKSGERGFYEVAVPNSILVYLFILSFVIIPLAKRFQRKGNYLMYLGIPVAIFIGYVLFSEVLFRYFGETAISRWYNSSETQVIPSVSVLAAILLIGLISFIVKRLIRKGQ